MSAKTLTRTGRNFPTIRGSVESGLSSVERSQLERIQAARDSWQAGQVANALLKLESVKSEQMSPPVAAACYVAEAAYHAEMSDFTGSLESLNLATPFIESATLSVQGAFYHQLGRAHKELGNFDIAFTNYAGAEFYWEQIGETEKLGAVLQNLSGLSLKMGDLMKAHEYSRRALDLFTKTDSIYLSQVYDTQAEILLAEGKIEAALESINTALEMVGENEIWQKQFQDTKTQILDRLVDLVYSAGFTFSHLQKEMVRRALIKHAGNLTRAGKEVGLTHKGISYIIDHNVELEPLRVERRVKLKSIIK